jgi:DNA-binding response OmpR family regulator
MNKRILLVDDDPRFRAAMVTVLEDLGVEIVHAANVMSANMEMQWGSFDFLIVDGQLPDGDGLSWLKTLREMKVTVPAVFISAHYRDSLSFKELVSELNVIHVFQKPVSIEVLREEFCRIFGIWDAGTTADIAAAMAGLSRDYALELQDALAGIKRKAVSARQTFSDPVLVDAIARESHKLRGTAGIFGFDGVGRLMAEIEDLMQTVLANKLKCAKAELWQEIESKVAIALLLAKAADSTAPQSKTPVKTPDLRRSGRSETAALQRSRILVLDDNRAFTRRVEAVLSAEGFLVYSFADSKHINEVVDELQPDLILLSNDMAGESTLDLVEKIRVRKGQNQAAAIIVCSEPSGSDNAPGESAAGGTEYMSKSISNSSLTAMVSGRLQQKKPVLTRSSE